MAVESRKTSALLAPLIEHLKEMQTCLIEERDCLSSNLKSDVLLGLAAQKRTLVQYIKKIEVNLTALLSATETYSIQQALFDALKACTSEVKAAFNVQITQYTSLAKACRELNLANGMCINQQLPRLETLYTSLVNPTSQTALVYTAQGRKQITPLGSPSKTQI